MAVTSVTKLKPHSNFIFNMFTFILVMSITPSALADVSAIKSNIQNTIESASQRSAFQNEKKINHWIDENQHHELLSAKQNNSQIKDQLVNSEKCLNISGIYVRGVSLLKPDELASLTELNRYCYTSKAINLLVRELTSLYIKEGYITARVLLSPLDKQKRLAVNVVEGKLEAIEVSNQESLKSYSQNVNPQVINTKMLFPNMLGKPLNLRNIEQGVDQANRLRSNHVTVNIKPGKAFGTSILSLNNQPSQLWGLTASVDNYGQKNTGKERASLAYSLDDPFGLNDYFTIGALSTLQNDALGFSRSYNLLYSVPYGRLTLNAFASYSSYGIYQQLPSCQAFLSGNSAQFGFKSDYVFFRDQRNIVSAYGEWIKKQSKNYFEHEKLSVSSFSYDEFELGISELHKFDTSTINMNLGVEKGLPELVLHQNNKLDQIPSLADFTKIKTNINYSHLFLLKNHAYQLSNHFFAQYAFQDLPSAETMNLADSTAIRGIVNHYLSSGSGAYLQSTLAGIYRCNYGVFSPRAGVDIGTAYYHDSDRKSDSAFGVSLGVNYNFQHLNVDFMVNKGFVLNHSSNVKEPLQVLAQVVVTI